MKKQRKEVRRKVWKRNGLKKIRMKVRNKRKKVGRKEGGK